MWSERQSTEIFHLSFLSLLGTRLDKALYALKGGANLRFFHGSHRFSEDVDFDVRTIAPATLRTNVERVLSASALDRQLAVFDIELAEWSAPNQTETTQRWKVRLAVPPRSVLVATKIEFSRRGLDAGTEFGAALPTVVGAYGLAPLKATHYGKRAAYWQKVAALGGRPTTQARDVFDLDLLLASGVVPGRPPSGLRRRLAAAIENAAGVSFDDFRGQVLPYLPREVASTHDRRAWDRLVLGVVDRLERPA